MPCRTQFCSWIDPAIAPLEHWVYATVLAFQRARIAHRLAHDLGLEQAAHDLAAARLGQRIDKLDRGGHGNGADLVAHMLLKFFGQGVAAADAWH